MIGLALILTQYTLHKYSDLYTGQRLLAICGTTKTRSMSLPHVPVLLFYRLNILKIKVYKNYGHQIFLV